MKTKLAYAIAILCIIQTAPVGCSKKKDSKAKSPATKAASVYYSRGALNLINMSQSFTANTPTGFRTTASFNLANSIDECNASAAGDEDKRQACWVVADINERFFQPSPTNIKDILSNFDKSLNGTIEHYSEMYTPCFDAARTAAGTFDIAIMGGTKSTTFSPFSLIPIPLKTTFNNAWAFDTGQSLNLSCLDSNDSSRKIGYGYKDGIWSLYQEEMSGTEFHGLFGTSDSKDNLDVWFAIGNPERDAEQAGMEEAAAAAEIQVPGSSSLYPMSTAIANVISRPEEGIVGISMVGDGVGPGCGSRLIMNNKTAYFKGNINNYGSCTQTDYKLRVAGSADAGTSANTPSMDSVEYCLDVSGTTPVLATAGMQSCYDSGLLTKADDGSMVDPFRAKGLKILTADTNSTTEDVVKARAWMGGFFMKGTDLSQIAPIGGVVAKDKVVISITGYSAKSWSMERTTSVDKQATAVTATCDATSNNTAALEESFSFSFADLIANTISNTSAGVTAPTEAQILADFNASIANTGDAAPYIEIPVQRTRGTTYRGNVEATSTATLDTTALGTAAIAIESRNSDAVTTVKIPLSGQTLTASSTLQITLTGTLTLNCDSATSSLRTVAVKPGLPRIVWYGKEKLQTK